MPCVFLTPSTLALNRLGESDSKKNSKSWNRVPPTRTRARRRYRLWAYPDWVRLPAASYWGCSRTPNRMLALGPSILSGPVAALGAGAGGGVTGGGSIGGGWVGGGGCSGGGCSTAGGSAGGGGSWAAAAEATPNRESKARAHGRRTFFMELLPVLEGLGIHVSPSRRTRKARRQSVPRSRVWQCSMTLPQAS